MKTGVKRENLEQELRKSIYDINLTRDYKEKVFNKLIIRGYSAGDIQKIISSNTPLEFLGLIDLGVIADAFYKVTNNVLVNPENYYTESELKLIAEYKEEAKVEDLSDLMTFDNMMRQSEDQWIGLISVQKFVQLLHSRKLNYNYQTQRNAKYEKHRDTLIQRPNINFDSVQEISKEMLEGSYIYDTITFNVLNTGDEQFTYSEETGKFVFKEGSLDLTDGMHRGKGSENALLINPNIKGNFILMLTNFDVDKANYYILQNDKRNPLEEEHKVSTNVADESTAIVKKLNESANSDIKGLITTDKMFIQEGMALTMFSTMSKTISKLWNPKTRKDVKDISDYLIEFFNELIGIHPEELKFNIKENRKKNFINHQNIFIYYLTIAKELQDQDNWEGLLNNIIERTDFSNNNSDFTDNIRHISAENFSKRINPIIRNYQKLIRGDLNAN